MNRRWIDRILWCCLLLMFASSVALLWGMAQGASRPELGPMARLLVQP